MLPARGVAPTPRRSHLGVIRLTWRAGVGPRCRSLITDSRVGRRSALSAVLKRLGDLGTARTTAALPRRGTGRTTGAALRSRFFLWVCGSDSRLSHQRHAALKWKEEIDEKVSEILYVQCWFADVQTRNLVGNALISYFHFWRVVISESNLTTTTRRYDYLTLWLKCYLHRSFFLVPITYRATQALQQLSDAATSVFDSRLCRRSLNHARWWPVSLEHSDRPGSLFVACRGRYEPDVRFP